MHESDQKIWLAAKIGVLGHELSHRILVPAGNRHAKAIVAGDLRAVRTVSNEEIENVAVAPQNRVLDVGPMRVSVVAAYRWNYKGMTTP